PEHIMRLARDAERPPAAEVREDDRLGARQASVEPQGAIPSTGAVRERAGLHAAHRLGRWPEAHAASAWLRYRRFSGSVRITPCALKWWWMASRYAVFCRVFMIRVTGRSSGT